ncbi:hypothetical protein GCM10027176_32750 [Actinoallomurus bryophytorum]
MRLLNGALALLAAGVLTPAAGTLERPALATGQPRRNGIGIRLVDAPVKARADSRAWRYIIDQLSPGAVIHRRVEVSNATSSSRHLSVYTAAAEIHNRKFQFAPARTPNELSTWTTANRHEMTLAPHGRSMVTTTITVPRDAADGERYAVIWAETASNAPSGGGVGEINRVGIRIYLSVGDGNSSSAFSIDSLTARRLPTGQQIVLAQVRNTGGRALDLSGDLNLRNASGSLSAGPFAAQTGTTLAPHDSGPVTIPLSEQVPNGPWQAHVRLQSGLTKRSADATITFPIAGAGETVKADTGFGFYPMVALVIVVILLAIMATRMLLRRRRNRTRQHASDFDQ